MTEHVCCPQLWDGAHSLSRCRLGGELTGSFSPGIGLWAVGAGCGLSVGLLCILKPPLIPREQLAQCSASSSVWCWL